ncbi:MAG TPA: histidine kinase [Longimicrobiaceae bacterium]|nr:histidine kinase [Longimicrobiaceae bacterium]
MTRPPRGDTAAGASTAGTSMGQRTLANRRLEWTVVCLGTVIPVINSSVWQYGRPLRGGGTVTVSDAAAIGAATALAWAATILGMFWLARRFPLVRGRVLQAVGVHLAAALLRALAWLPFSAFVSLYLVGEPPPFPWRRALVPVLYSEVVSYVLVLGTIYAVQYYERLRDREMDAARLAGHLAEARLSSLKMQLNPHFLFNTLHSVSTLMHRDVEAADEMLARLSVLLRLSLQHHDTQEVTLQQEMEFLVPYLEIEQIRFRDRLTVRTHLARDTLAARVPHLILQPLVENAIRHGIAPRAGPGTVEVSVERVDGALRLVVQDDGVGVGASEGGRGTGVGLSNTRARLQALYGEAHRFAVEPAPGGGTRVTVSIPMRENGGVVEAHREEER